MTGGQKARVLKAAAVGELIALGLMGWSFVHAHPLASVAALTIGQGLGTLAFVSFVAVLLANLRGSESPSGPEEIQDGEEEP